MFALGSSDAKYVAAARTASAEAACALATMLRTVLRSGTGERPGANHGRDEALPGSGEYAERSNIPVV